MFTDFLIWISSRTPEDWAWTLFPFLMFDCLRYTFLPAALCFYDFFGTLIGRPFRFSTPKDATYFPSVAVMIVGINEADTIEHALRSIYGTYPNLEIFVVDDGSTDGMAEKAERFAAKNRNVTVLRRKQRGGKSSAMNMPLPFIKSEIIVVIDSDSELAPGAIPMIVQPFADPKVGAVSGCVSSRNPKVNLCTFMQAFEYRRSIFLGRLFLARMGLLGIVSGALGAFRKSALDQVGAWDVGPGEDGDLTLRLRKAGYEIGFVPEALCLTNVPTAWKRLIKQRRRWEWAAITFECRKHIDMANPFNKHFNIRDFILIFERWLFNVFLVFINVGYFVYLFTCVEPDVAIRLLGLCYVAYLLTDVLQSAMLMCYSPDRKRDWPLLLAVPLMPLYYLLMKFVTFWAITEELLFRRSFRDNFVPERVRKVTWHW